MTSSRPYLLRAFYEWIVDNKSTPYVVVNAELDNVEVPVEYVENGRIVLNISPGAVRSLLIANDHLEFNARFNGVPYDIYTPIKAITAIYAKENGRGMVFKDDEDDDEPPPTDTQEDVSGKGGKSGQKGSGKGDGKKGRPNLTIVK
mgnify:CR=1 FL=1|tara:strand:+ start:30695 stop:31132 length:438 start_codon:yes stop_codon:yes gene_type:complete